MNRDQPFIDPGDLDGVASDWIARRDAGLTAAEEAELRAWLAADPRHAAVWREYDVSWQLFDQPYGHGATDAMLTMLDIRQQRRRKRVALASGLLAAAAALLIAFVPLGNSTAERDMASAATVLRPSHRELPDGSTIELNTGAEVEVAYSKSARRITLLRGEAHFVVEKDAKRPFIVTARDIEVRAVGTAFLVGKTPRGVDVLVTHGTVAVNRAAVRTNPAEVSTGNDVVTLEIGDRLRLPSVDAPLSEIASPEHAAAGEMQRMLDWRGPRVELTATPLAEAVAIFNRENRVQLSIADPELAGMKLSGIFRVDNAEGLVRLLQENYGLRVYRDGDRVILREAR